MVIRLLFHLESNIMMTLKLDMKHICKKEVRAGEGGVYLGAGGGGLWEAGGEELCSHAEGRPGAQSFSEDGIQMYGPDCSSMISLILL